MIKLQDYIQEKLQINKDSKAKPGRDNWTIETAKNGDIIHWNNTGLYFIYKCLNDKRRYADTNSDAIVYHVAGNIETNKVYLGPDTGVGSYKNPELFELATDEEVEKFLKFLNEQGYKWNDKKLALLKI